MKKHLETALLLLSLTLVACQHNTTNKTSNEKKQPMENEWVVDRFADLEVLRYKVNGFDKLSLKQKELVYYLTQAGLAGRDIAWDQNFKYNLAIRTALEHIYTNFQGDKSSNNWKNFEIYLKRVWFSNGIHHHYGMNKIMPAFSEEYFEKLKGETKTSLIEEAQEAIFSSTKYMYRKVKDATQDMIVLSANNFYGDGVTQKMVEDYYANIIDPKDETPIEYGLNSTMILNEKGELVEDVWKSGGRYGKAIDKIIFWLEKATTVAENEPQKKALLLLIEYYKTGDLKTWDQYNIAWAGATEGDIDYINGFIEVYGDAIGKRAGFESIVEINDFEASKRMSVVSGNAQWFEDHSPILKAHKKEKVTGVSYKVVNVAGESGDASPSTPIGVNLPNNNWIRTKHGSKSVSLGNLIEAYEKASGGGMLAEFANDEEEIERCKKYSDLADKMHTALHEVIGHASGKINPGIGQPAATLKNYASTLEEGRADLVGLYYLMDPKLVELGLMPSLEVGKAAYDDYIRNGLLTQLRRIEKGNNLSEEHMQNRQLIAAWVFEQGKKENVIEKIERNGKTYYNITDYNKLRILFGELLREIQRIKSEGDYEAGKHLVETYGVVVNQKTLAEVLNRVEPLNLAPYKGFVNPILVPVMDASGQISNIEIKASPSFAAQMLDYAKNYSFLK
jgi:dipeptidyl-peptidase-3